MESIYYVMCWACHRRCVHCYDNRFRPYVRGDLEAVVAEAEAHFPAIVANLPETMTYRVPGDPHPHIGRVILAGGEPLLEPVRTRVLYPVIDLLRAKYGPGGVRIVVQTTGDLVTEALARELLERGVWLVNCAGFDDYHVGMEGDRKRGLADKLDGIFTELGAERVGLSSQSKGRAWLDEDGPFFNLMGAEPGSWIGELWPRGRAWANGLSQAGMETNFCARQSGGWRFLNKGERGAEVALEPDGSLYPCCLKTKLPLGSVAEEPLEAILDSLRGHPVFEAINAGEPQRMGETLGWSVADYEARSHGHDPTGRDYANLCLGCDAFFEETMGPVLRDLRSQRLAGRRGAAHTGGKTD